MLTTAIRVDAIVKSDVRAFVMSDDRLRPVREKLGLSPRQGVERIGVVLDQGEVDLVPRPAEPVRRVEL
jgi:hypothetical protein